MALLNSFKDLLFSDMINHFDPKMLIMWAIGGLLIFLAIKKEMEPTLLLPMGFGAILVNLPFSGAITQILENGKNRKVLCQYFLTQVSQTNSSHSFFSSVSVR